MKTNLFKAISVLLAVVLLVASVPLGGFVGLDWSDFAVKVWAADDSETETDEEETNAIDYSYLTPNQYMAKVLLNYNYSGCANSYGERATTIPGEQMRWYTNANNVSAARPLYNYLNNSDSFSAGVAAWRALNFDPSEAYEDLLDEEGYYEAILMSILDVQMNDSEFLSALNSSANKTIMSLSKSTLKNLEYFKDLEASQINFKKMNISDFTDEEFKEIYSYVLDTRETRNLYKQAGSYLSDANMIKSTCTTLYDVYSTVGKYAQLADVSESIKNVLYSIYINCPSSNKAMKSACKKVYETASEQMSQATITFITAGEAFLNNAFSYVIGEAWKWAKKTVLTALGSSLLVGMDLGRVIGSTITNFAFSTDRVIEQFYVIECLLKFENVMTSVVSGFESTYKANESVENADNYMKSLEMLFSVYDIDYDYAFSFVQTAKERGAYNVVKSWLSGKDETVESYRSSISVMKSSMSMMKDTLTNLEGFRWYYEDDAPQGYDDYFNSHNSISASYSKTATVTNIAPMVAPESDSFIVLQYRLENDKTITITRCNPSSSGVIEIPKEFGGYAVREIGYSAFQGCTGITRVVMPSTLRTIGNYAFSGCTNLSSVELNNNLKSIGYGAFSGTAITSITIPKTVTSMSDSVFSGAEKLQTVIFEYGIGKIPSYALRNCKSVTKVVIPEGVTEIGYYAFSGCTGLMSIAIPDSVITINDSAFRGCTGLTSIAIPDSVTTVGDYAFCGCTGLTSISTPDSVTTIYDHAFYGCTNLSSVTLNNNLKSIGYGAFSGTAITSITIPKTVTSMSDSVFSGAEKLQTVIFEYGIGKIPSYALRNCKSVTKVVIPEGVTEIGYYAFSGCTGLTDVYFSGTEEAWGEVKINDNNAPLSTATMHYNYSYAENCDHRYTLTETKEPTCTAKGQKTFICSGCGTKLYEDIEALGHDYRSSWTIDKKATCTKAGEKSHHCKVCDAKTDITTIKATGHIYGEWVTTKEATCTAKGTKQRTCTTCNYTATKTIAALGHSYSADWTVDTAPTCTTVGSESRHCTRCDATTDTLEIEATGHSYGSWKTTKKATCTESGKKQRVCLACGNISSSTIKATGHKYGEWATTKEATCAAKGTMKRTCSTCGKTVSKTIAALDHDYSTEWQVDTAPTCTTAGSESRHCTRCDATTDAIEIEPTGHTYGSWKTMKKATCTEAGTKKRICSTCRYAETKTIAKTGHTYKTTTTKATTSKAGSKVTACTVCGKVKSTTTIAKISTVKLSYTSYTYSGSTKKPTVTVTDSNGNKLVKDTDYTVKYASGRKNVGKYTVTVTFKGNYSGTKTLTFTIKPKGATISKLTAGTKKFTVKLNELPTQITGYQIQYSTSSKMTSATTKTYTTATKTSRTISNLKSAKTYYVRVRTYKTVDGTKIYSSWSSAKSVKTK